ncbi:hypothetical protein L195_g021171 [Trifolium pratense]|uniref:Uncharacterized protein n=1 Tax=Trifolium pratense TaxID=57577 RepID=A0A2K3N4I2_TRIPR|nr:hypothetical protein L195_g021171 [Trifolium pratense]
MSQERVPTEPDGGDKLVARSGGEKWCLWKATAMVVVQSTVSDSKTSKMANWYILILMVGHMSPTTMMAVSVTAPRPNHRVTWTPNNKSDENRVSLDGG